MTQILHDNPFREGDTVALKVTIDVPELAAGGLLGIVIVGLITGIPEGD